MKTLKLQMQLTIDGFVAGPEGQLDWMMFAPDQKLLAFINHLTDTSDTIVMGRKMSGDFCKYWEGVSKDDPQYSFAQKMVQIPKVIFSKTETKTTGINARMQNGDLKTEINKLKSGSGKDIVAYGGANFASELIRENLVDDYYLFLNPVSIGNGLRIFLDRTKLKLVDATPYEGGKVVIHYKPAR